MAQIKLNIEEMQSCHEALERANQNVLSLSFKVASRQSNSRAMDEFERQIKLFKKLMHSYSSLLDDDCGKLLSAVRGIEDADSDLATRYFDSIEDIRGVSDSTGSETSSDAKAFDASIKETESPSEHFKFSSRKGA